MICGMCKGWGVDCFCNNGYLWELDDPIFNGMKFCNKRAINRHGAAYKKAIDMIVVGTGLTKENAMIFFQRKLEELDDYAGK